MRKLKHSKVKIQKKQQQQSGLPNNEMSKRIILLKIKYTLNDSAYGQNKMLCFYAFFFFNILY